MLYYFNIYFINIGWIRIRNFCLDPELGKFKTGSGSGINNSGFTTLQKTPVSGSETLVLPAVLGWKDDEGDDCDVTSAGLKVVVEPGQRFDKDVPALVAKLVPTLEEFYSTDSHSIAGSGSS